MCIAPQFSFTSQGMDLRDVKLKADGSLPLSAKANKAIDLTDDALMLYHLGHLVFNGKKAALFLMIVSACAAAVLHCACLVFHLSIHFILVKVSD